MDETTDLTITLTLPLAEWDALKFRAMDGVVAVEQNLQDNGCHPQNYTAHPSWAVYSPGTAAALDHTNKRARAAVRLLEMEMRETLQRLAQD